MATIIELDGIAPTIGEDVFLAESAVLAGDVRVGDRANIWFGLSGSALDWTRTAADEYQQFSKRYMTATRVLAAGEERVA